MFKLTKILMLLWLLYCISLTVMNIGGRLTSGVVDESGAAATTRDMTGEETVDRNPDLSQQEGEDVASPVQDPAVAGGDRVLGPRLIEFLLIWMAGMIPLLIMFVVLKPSATTVMVQKP